MTYTAEKPRNAEPSDELRARIPGWGVDLDAADRPFVPRERFDPSLSGAHWDFPERLPEKWPRERSIEHAFLTPVFGTSTPPRGASGAMRKAPSGSDNPNTDTGVLGELRRHPISSRFGRKRADVVHQPLDPLLVAGPWVLGGWGAYRGVKALRTALRRRR